ncbi:MAG TPA: carboxypeptidase-like regulatory domain-containing protein [Pyrinomonadaceae bacterium]|nr:carboxypeptidase-like regulatory domain-containing protein [Pyrinomonadaceae bacterium]
MTTRNLLIVWVAVFALPVFISTGAKAQRGQASSIQGTVEDTNNARIVGARVMLESAHLRREVETNDQGNFQVELPPDDYRISVEKAGFKRFVLSSFRTQNASQHNLTIRLKVKDPAMPLKIK